MLLLMRGKSGTMLPRRRVRWLASCRMKRFGLCSGLFGRFLCRPSGVFGRGALQLSLLHSRLYFRKVRILGLFQVGLRVLGLCGLSSGLPAI